MRVRLIFYVGPYQHRLRLRARIRNRVVSAPPIPIPPSAAPSDLYDALIMVLLLRRGSSDAPAGVCFYRCWQYYAVGGARLPTYDFVGKATRSK